jgi:hypothetical protein
MSVTENAVTANFENDIIAPAIGNDVAILTGELNGSARAPIQNINNGMSVASLVLGIASVSLFWVIPYVTIASSIIGLILGVLSKKQKSGMGRAGFVISIIALVLSAIVLALIIVPAIYLAILFLFGN